MHMLSPGLRGAKRTTLWLGSRIPLNYSPCINGLGKSNVLKSGESCKPDYYKITRGYMWKEKIFVPLLARSNNNQKSKEHLQPVDSLFMYTSDTAALSDLVIFYSQVSLHVIASVTTLSALSHAEVCALWLQTNKRSWSSLAVHCTRHIVMQQYSNDNQNRVICSNQSPS